MRVRVRYFASVREVLGRSEEVLEVVPGATVDSVWLTLVAREPRLAGFRVRGAVNQEYALGDAEMRDGDELAFIPPVSGGQEAWLSRSVPSPSAG